MSKQQKEKSVTKDKLVGMKVITADGKLVGTVKDVGFTIGQAGISLSVEDETGDLQDIAWERVQGATDFVVLKMVEGHSTGTVAGGQTAQPVQQSQQTQQSLCQTCGKPLNYIQQYQRWYCYTCKKYV